jgi:Tryptophan-associated transmembrane protein (Trp_oprn_chp)
VKRARGYAATVAMLGAGLALLAASRPWAPSPTNLSPGRLTTAADGLTGAALYPLIPALALAALAGGGALLATGGAVRAGVGGLLLLCGTGIVLCTAYAVAREAAPLWPIAAAVGGLAVFDAGWLTVRKGRSWPAMGTRFERSARTAEPSSMWDELDRGGDPTQ